jgi:hypothetical protein
MELPVKNWQAFRSCLRYRKLWTRREERGQLYYHTISHHSQGYVNEYTFINK